MTNLPEIGDVIDGTYEIQNVLGTGGFGAVYRARQINMDRDVALKLLVASGAKFDEMVKRFRREVMAIRNLNHPNTIQIYDFRDNPDGLLYYTMEALDGQTLKDAVRDHGPLSPRRLKHVMRQVLKSLSEAHSYNIVHRDLKPANIMLVDMHGETDFVKVLDFGIAKRLQDEEEEGDEKTEDLTSAGILVGTLRYMAPEQITGEDLGPHTDLYALGLIALEMLTGQSVFEGTGRWEVLQQQISEDPVAIPEVILRSEIGPVIRQCLEKRPGPRFSTADEVLRALGAIDDSKLGSEALYKSDGEGGWIPRNSDPGESLRTVKVEPIGRSTGLVVGDDSTADLDGKTTITHVDELPSGEFYSPEPMAAQSALEQKKTTPHSSVRGSAGSGALPLMTAPQDRTDSVAFTPSKVEPNKTLLLGVGILFVIVVLGGVAMWMMQSSPGAEQVEEPQGLVAVENTESEQPEEEHASDRLEGEEEPDVKAAQLHSVMVEVESGVRALIYVDDVAMGRAPHRVEFAEDEQVVVRLEAQGYEDLEETFDQNTPETVELVMASVEDDSAARAGRGAAPETTRSERDSRPSGSSSSRQPSQPSQPPEQTRRSEPDPPSERSGASDWVDIDSPSEPREESSSGGSDDWLDIPSTPREEEEKEEADEIPLF